MDVFCPKCQHEMVWQQGDYFVSIVSKPISNMPIAQIVVSHFRN